MEKSLAPNPGAERKGKKKKLTEGQKRRRNRYNYEKERKKREAAAAAALTSTITDAFERSLVFTSADLPLRPIATVGPSVGPILPTLPAGPSTAPDPPLLAKENRNPNILKEHCNNCHSANHFPSEEERARKFIQRRRERELEQAAWQKAIEERRAKERCERLKIAEAAKKKQEEEEIERMRMEIHFVD